MWSVIMLNLNGRYSTVSIAVMVFSVHSIWSIVMLPGSLVGGASFFIFEIISARQGCVIIFLISGSLSVALKYPVIIIASCAFLYFCNTLSRSSTSA